MIELNYGYCVNEKKFNNGINLSKLKFYKDVQLEVTKGIFNKKISDMLEWIDLPNPANKRIIEDIKETGQNIRQNFDNVIVLGIGGSALGIQTLKDSLTPNDKIDIPRVEICDNVDPTTFDNLLSQLDAKKTMFIVISKSGKTIETLSQFSVVINFLKKDLKSKYTSNIVIISGKETALYDFALQNNIKKYQIPNGVGGRFSVLSPVGLLPAVVMGIDIDKLLQGANKMLEHSKNAKFADNISYLTSLINYTLMKNGKDEIVIMPYSDKLSSMADFYCQLIGESLAKQKCLNNKPNKLILTPIKAKGTTDQHSQLQLYNEGKNNKIYCFIRVENHKNDVNVPKLKIDEVALPKTLGELINLEQQATATALRKNNRPSYTIVVPKITEENVGALLFYFEITTAFMGVFMNIDAYNQPGVEQGKIYTKALLGDEKYISEKNELDKYFELNQKYRISE